MKAFHLTKGLVAIVDDEDYDNLSQFKWYSVGHSGKEYAARYGGKYHNLPQHIRMHRVIMDAPVGIEVDHINGNRLDNRRENLRLATRAENGRNRSKYKGSMHSDYKGVTWHNRDECWQGTICVDGKYIHLGYFSTEQEAALAYNNAAKEYHGEFAKPNKI